MIKPPTLPALWQTKAGRRSLGHGLGHRTQQLELKTGILSAVMFLSSTGSTKPHDTYMTW